MEQRERTEEHVVRRRQEHTFALLDVAHQVQVRQFHALRTAFGTGTEDDGRHVVEAHLLEEPEFQIPGRQNHHAQEILYKR